MTDAVTVAAWTRCLARALLAAPLAAVLAGCALPANPHMSGPLSTTAGVTSGMAMVLRFGDQAVTATLTDTPPSRQFAAMLPLTLQLTDAWGQAKAGRLPRALTAQGGTPVHDPTPGEVYFWPSNGVIAVYYDDLGQMVPDPGLVRLGIIEAGLDRLAAAGKQVTVRIEPAAATRP
ncbi:cyclophilin-like fold protein [Nonomuraea sp. NPDC051941]|uniref:cyclophilin-like fold protein n=1 Tax=Nonomuraea sp. NPDC051941 TaxID=3364373 RepID=UPI0037C58F56